MVRPDVATELLRETGLLESAIVERNDMLPDQPSKEARDGIANLLVFVGQGALKDIIARKCLNSGILLNR